MRILIAEDDYVSRKYLYKLLSQYGECDMVVDGLEAIEAYMISMRENNSYDFICLDIMLPKVDGVKVLKAIRNLEDQRLMPSGERVKVIITTALAEAQFVQRAFNIGCDAYLAKPIDMEKLIDTMKKLGLIIEK
jgi:two-component system, chemotaxis family, chemotaxis protein CheY